MSETLCVCCRRHAVEHAWRPFCSERCQLQDLARWADGTYSVPAEPVDDVDSDDGSSSESESEI